MNSEGKNFAVSSAIDSGATSRRIAWSRGVIWSVCAVSFFLVVHNFGFSLLPDVAILIDPAEMRPVPAARTFEVTFHHSPGDTRTNPRSRIRLTEDGMPFPNKTRIARPAHQLGTGVWCHEPGRIVFSSSDNTDPRTNGRRYVVHSPPLYSRGVGYAALTLLILGLLVMRRARPATSDGPGSHMRGYRWHVVLAGVVFTTGLYLNTGTLAPYANTLSPIVDKRTGFLYNMDHAQHRMLPGFVSGEPRETWEDSMLLRRILHPVLARPWVDAFGYELGGVLLNGVLNLAGFALGIAMIHHRVGRRGAVLAAWLLALYPGAHYWVGQPYQYGVIFPLGIAAFWLLLELGEAGFPRLVLFSFSLGVLYLAYDFHLYFLPASLLLLLWQRRMLAALVSVGLQALPLLTWIWLLKHVVRVSLETKNTEYYRTTVDAFLDWRSWLTANQVLSLPEVAAEVFLGANFIFLPLLMIAIWAVDFEWRWFLRHRAVTVLFLTALALFGFVNLPPAKGDDWSLQGAVIARLYQPIFPALVFCAAHWWQQMLPANRVARRARYVMLAVAFGGNALICFGPVLNNPGGISGKAFYRFYDHTDMHWHYPKNLAEHGRRPIGFPRPVNPP